MLNLLMGAFMKVYFGARAMSRGRELKLLKSLRSLLDETCQIEAFTSHFVHFVAIRHEPDETDEGKLRQLLDYGHASEKEVMSADRDFFLVVPRIGTISPWSSKATDIARN